MWCNSPDFYLHDFPLSQPLWLPLCLTWSTYSHYNTLLCKLQCNSKINKIILWRISLWLLFYLTWHALSLALCSNLCHPCYCPNTLPARLWGMDERIALSTAGLSEISVSESCVSWGCVLLFSHVPRIHATGRQRQKEYTIIVTVLQYHF
jgi:hypothetical protein